MTLQLQWKNSCVFFSKHFATVWRFSISHFVVHIPFHLLVNNMKWLSVKINFKWNLFTVAANQDKIKLRIISSIASNSTKLQKENFVTLFKLLNYFTTWSNFYSLLSGELSQVRGDEKQEFHKKNIFSCSFWDWSNRIL